VEKNPFSWKVEHHSVNVPAMDEQHAHIVSIMNRLYEASTSGTSKDALILVFKELLGYVQKHFSDEEAYMASVGFEGLASHRQIHKEMLAGLKMHFKQFEKGISRPSEEFFTFLKVWVSSHIQGVDRKYGEFTKVF